MPDATSSSATARGAALTIERVTHRYSGSVALNQMSLAVAGGELLSLLGPSGCGKTTLLRVIGGFIQQTEGRVLIGGQAVDHLPANKRTVGIVFQNYALFPHMTVARDIANGLEARRTPKPEIRARVDEMLGLVHLGAFANRMPRELFGGQQQRVALARALAVRPSILLLEEPFAALDKNLRLDMQIEVKRIQRLSGTTTILVTHDQEEALSMSDRIAVLNQGRLEQLATPAEIYDRPASLFVNTFVGTANMMPGILAGAFIAFMSSFDNVPVSLFLRDARTDMLPIRMWQDLEGKLDVSIAAVSGVMIVLTLGAMILMERLTGLSRRPR